MKKSLPSKALLYICRIPPGIPRSTSPASSYGDQRGYPHRIRSSLRVCRFFPEIQFHIPGVGGCFQIAGEVVPAVIAVEADDVHRSGYKIPLIIILAADEGYRAVLGIQLMGKLIEGMPVIISGFRKMFGIRFVSHGPHDNTGVILSRATRSRNTCSWCSRIGNVL